MVGWLHAQPPDPNTIDPLTRGPKASLGGPPLAPGAFGETYPPDVEAAQIRAYLSNKAMTATFQKFGIVEVGDLQMDVAVPFSPEPYFNIVQLEQPLVTAYNAGEFANVAPGPQKTVTFDQFIIGGVKWVAKARPVPLLDANVVIAWRLLIARKSAY